MAVGAAWVMMGPMKRRWFIRGLFMLPILLCIVGWGWSRTHWVWILYCLRGNFVGCDTFWGCIGLGYGKTDFSNGWYLGREPTTAGSHFWPPPNAAPQSFYGFGCEWTAISHTVYMPCWFPIFLSSLALFFAWRRTRPKTIGEAFPVVFDKDGKVQP